MSTCLPPHHPHDPPAVHHGDPVGQGQDLVQVLRDQQGRRPLSRCRSSRRCTYSVALTSSPRVGWAASSTAGPAGQLPRQDQLLDVPPGQAHQGRAAGGGAHLEAPGSAARHSAAIRRRSRKIPRANGGRPWSFRIRFSSTENSRTAPSAPVPRGCRTGRAASSRAGAQPVTSGAPSRILPRAGRRRPAIASASSRCPLPDDAGDPQDLPRAHLQVDSPQRRRPSSPRRPRRPRGTGRCARWPPPARVDLRPDLPPDHQPGQLLAGWPARRAGCVTTRPSRSTVIRSLRASTSLQLVADEDHRVPLARSCASASGSARSTSCGREHGGRLIEDEQGGAAVQGLQDLHPLLLADGQLPDPGGRVDVPARSARPARRSAGPPRPGPGASRREEGRPSAMFSATVKVGTSMKCWCTIPIPRRMASSGRMEAAPAARRSGSPLPPGGTSRRGSSSACSCPPRSPRAGHGSRPPGPGSRRGRWPARRGTA